MIGSLRLKAVVLSLLVLALACGSQNDASNSEEFDALLALSQEKGAQSPPSTTVEEAEQLRDCAGDAVDFLVVSGEEPGGEFTSEMQARLYDCVDALGLRERLTVTLSAETGELDPIIETYNQETRSQLECLHDNGFTGVRLAEPDDVGYVTLEFTSAAPPSEDLRDLCVGE